jgi:exosortase/archaeosortase family protein
MVTLFLGSLFGQSLVSRLLSLVILPLVVIVVNTFRAMFLSVQVIVNGDEAYESWHDPAGYIAFGVSMVIIYATIELFNIVGSGSQSSQSLNLKQIWSKWEGTRAKPVSLVYLCLPILVFLVVESWFRIHEWQAPPQKGWELVLPDQNDPDYLYDDIHKRVEELLGYSFGYKFYYGITNHAFAEVYYYGFNEDNKLSSVSSYGHIPTICIEGSGGQLVDELDPLIMEIGDVEIHIKHYLFRIPRTGEYMNVFWTVWENRNMNISPDSLIELTPKTAWIQLRHGRRDYSRKVLLTSLMGMNGPAEARTEVRSLFEKWLTPTSG